MSASMWLLGRVLQRGARSLRTEAGMRARIAGPKGDPAPPAKLRERHVVERRAVGAFSSYRVVPHGGAAHGVVVYLHGGGYYGEINQRHWLFVDQLVRQVGCQVEVPIYGLAPQHTPDEALALLDDVYTELLASHDPGRIVIAGDSAGGGLGLAFVQRLVADGRPVPGRLLLLAPWVDLALDDPEAAVIGPRDPILSIAGGRVAGLAWAGELDVRDPRVSPVHGSMEGLPPLEVYVGTRDLFLPDCQRLVGLVAAAGGDARLRVRRGALHVYVLAPLPEGRRDRRRIVRDLRTHLAAQG